VLTDTAIRGAKRRSKPYKLSDFGGLHLLITTTGAKLWRLNYRFAGKQKTLALGIYQEAGSTSVLVTLADARVARDAAKRLLQQGVDPGAQKKADKLAARAAATTFGDLADDWFEVHISRERAGLAERTVERARWLVDVLKKNLGTRAVADIEPPEILDVLRKVEARGHHETVSRLRSTCSRIFKHGIASGKCRRDPAADIRGALTAPKVAHRPAIIDPTAIGALMRAIDGYDGNPITRLGLRLLALTFVRPGELRFAEWQEINVRDKLWIVPGGRTKMRRDHLVPLSRQTLAVLDELKPLSGSEKLVFPSLVSRDRPISENTLNTALRRMGYAADEMVAHGFRAMASTRLRELNRWPNDVIERQLAHVEGNSVRRAYNRAEHLPLRVEMMQAWADYLDSLGASGRVVPLRTQATA
jgi:integrase